MPDLADLINDRLDLVPCDAGVYCWRLATGEFHVTVPRFTDLREIVRGNLQGVHWIARLTGCNRRDGEWVGEYEVMEPEQEKSRETAAD